ncbi:MAG: amino acid racemase [Chloroflexota bacterium]
MKKIIGIIGGMGPQATIDLYQQIVNLTPASVDQEHLHMLIDSYPQIPDRTEALLNGGEDPLPYLAESANRLQAAGANCLIIPCNTAHAFVYALQQTTSIPILNMIDETARYITDQYPRTSQAGLLATSGTVEIGLYQKALQNFQIDTVTPNLEEQSNLVMEAIYGEAGIKAGCLGEHPTLLLKQAAQMLIEQGATVIIGGCTEIPLVLDEDSLPVPFINPSYILAKKAVEFALDTSY